MNYAEYQKHMLPLARYPNKGYNYIYPTLGLSGESGEFALKVVDLAGVKDPEYAEAPEELKKPLLLELGDILWYVTSCAYELGTNLEEVCHVDGVPRHLAHFDEELPAGSIFIHALTLAGKAGEFTDKIKKIIRDKEGIILPEDFQVLKDKLTQVVISVHTCALDFDSSLGEVAQMNVIKLLDRNKRNVLQGEGDDR